ncbi:endo-1,4-beta-xylanase 5 [Mercurialis annua]|uniref:endo-1,4-beta-xylanase 5 n=1 Tax=Mercurialis annua TaxID=3986 RepID=UPI00215DDADD|nr:endo-1,4-beta-xylanase 5 [Mercurialis annua]
MPFLTNKTFCFSVFFLLFTPSFALSYDGPFYDYTAYTECKSEPEKALYNGGIIKDQPILHRQTTLYKDASAVFAPALILHNLTRGIYCFSMWVKIEGADSSRVTASLTTNNDERYNCIGTVLARTGCWSFLKGGFILDAPSNLSILYFQNSGDKNIKIEIASASLQPFSDEQWRANQQHTMNTVRKRAVTIHVSDSHGNRLDGANITIQQISKDFPLGSSISSTILGNLPYQTWFVERFDAAVFENELKWYATEPEQGKLNYTIPDQMLEFLRANQILGRGHNIFWEDPKYIPKWVQNLTSNELKSAVNLRIQSLMSKYKEEFIHWDVSNEMLHFDFYEQRLGPDATLRFYETAHEADPLATLFMNEFNVVETCSDTNSTVDAYISRLRELESGGIFMDGIGLESHFSVPNLPLVRGILDKLATLGLPIWLTEVDISNKFDHTTQAIYLEQVLREGFSHPAVDGIMLWTALDPKGCYQMCLTDNNLQNLAAGDVVDNLLKEWKTRVLNGQTDEFGSFSFYGFLGEYRIHVQFANRTSNSTFSLWRSQETKYFNVQL